MHDKKRNKGNWRSSTQYDLTLLNPKTKKKKKVTHSTMDSNWNLVFQKEYADLWESTSTMHAKGSYGEE